MGGASSDRRSAGSLLRALRDRLRGARTDSVGTATGGPTVRPSVASDLPDRIGPYRVVRQIGQGGMGVVFEARDDRLERAVAIKTIKGGPDDQSAKRFLREARAAAGLNHPHVCHVYEIGEHEGGLFIAMELLAGESLQERLLRGAMLLGDALPVGLGILSALQALHAHGLVHRDLKPSNVFLTPHGVKLLDFGLARSSVPFGTLTSPGELPSDLTQPGAVVGTPRYMSPEQVQGRGVDFRTDLFAVGAVLFEMLAGRPAFLGETVVEILYATLHEHPPALTGSSGVIAADRVIRRALAKDPRSRPASAEAMGRELAAIPQAATGEAQVSARPLTRLVVLPFRLLRPDSDMEFLGPGLADAISTSLAGLKPLVVRSSAAAARFTGESPDLKSIAAEVDVDLVMLGTLLRAGGEVRATAQLVEAPAGTLVASHVVQTAVGDVFRLQDELARRIVASLALPLGGREAPRKSEAPESAHAYELFLRANERSRDYSQMKAARDLYERCLAEDPRYAPAWARLGRAHRLVGKYIEDADGNGRRAEEAFLRALELAPDLSIAHKLYAHFEAESGRVREAMSRLLGRAREDRNDAELFAGLVHACRYAGLFEASVAAHEEARRLDPHVPTSLAFTLYLHGDFDRLLREGDSVIDVEPKIFALVAQDRMADARALSFESPLPAVFGKVAESLRAWVDGRREEAADSFEECVALHRDPEAFYMIASGLAQLGRPARALEVLERAVGTGYFVAPALRRDPLLDPVRGEPAFGSLVARAEEGRALALSAFREAGGDMLLGVARSSS